ncbi:MAG: Asp-tRNA(Asn)/Glu-tRNA(Gln) amidotransferase GatCAB subunit C [Candidatus Komeilibacteria bacterium CG_4_10_14_0_2_um_filter_37_10]|uniref:Asp-tRNA(Asn)/Glu-tRNA(Gln) amidotransferase GatCAB subunit C n=1 Tax=Candidatus Komeilibacteria bacterium CG_4_10_14_0_2_um_filter_37_10 TaxID=1974470 RepID=A0A2M7VF13_9BACT|nr:MAG: Asp-tRNA(Asn)/Glu-tRNA(Gln) amidotransferase GatCAB subunit C [Candidatus Komeilibacteria bacterium CG_4_10_14_0_2_um_filter_37_10]
MSLDKKQLKYLAELAKINITPAEEDRLLKQLSSILAYVQSLQDISCPEEIDHFADPVKNVNIWRADQVAPISEITRQKLLACAGEVENNLIRTKPVF